MGIDMALLLKENARDIATDCKINNQPINDKTLIENFCPGLEAFNGTTPNLQEIFGKLQTKSDPTFLTKAALEFLEMKQTARDRLKEIYNIRSDYDLAQILAVFPEKTSSLIRVITRALLRLNSKEVTAVVDLFEKDFIFIPIQRKAQGMRHWFLMVICFPMFPQVIVLRSKKRGGGR